MPAVSRKSSRKPVLVIMAVAGVCAFLEMEFFQKRQHTLQQYLKQNLPRMMSAQEKKIGIKHFSTPHIPLNLNNTCTPNQIVDLMTIATAIYDKKNNEIYLSPHLFQRTAFSSFTSFFDSYFDLTHASIDPAQLSQLKSTLDHELGHFYTDTLSEHLNRQDWPPKEGVSLGFVTARHYVYKMFSEGIAVYFAHAMNSENQVIFSDNDWPKTINDLTINQYKIFYDGGYHFVRPIIDKHGARGIEYLVQYKPKEEDLFALPALQKRMLEELAQERKDKELNNQK